MSPKPSRPKTRTRAVVFGLLTVFVGAACDLEAKTVTMRIDHYRDPCWGSGPDFCLRVIESSDPSVAMPRRIDGFEHDWGHVYEVQVQVQELAFAAEDGAAHYGLVEVLSQESAPTDATFMLPLTGEFVARVDGRRFDLVGGLSVECGDESVCTSVAQALRSDDAFTVELGYPPAPGRSLVAHSIVVLDE
jgi:hypothetical protein